MIWIAKNRTNKQRGNDGEAMEILKVSRFASVGEDSSRSQSGVEWILPTAPG